MPKLGQCHGVTECVHKMITFNKRQSLHTVFQVVGSTCMNVQVHMYCEVYMVKLFYPATYMCVVRVSSVTGYTS